MRAQVGRARVPHERRVETEHRARVLQVEAPAAVEVDAVDGEQDLPASHAVRRRLAGGECEPERGHEERRPRHPARAPRAAPRPAHEALAAEQHEPRDRRRGEPGDADERVGEAGRVRARAGPDARRARGE